MRVVDEARERLVLCDVCEERQRPKRYQEPVGRSAGGKSERDAQCMLLGRREAINPGEHRRAELMERRIRQLHLGFDPGDLGHSKPGSLLSDRPNERRLADASLASDDQDRTAASARVAQKLRERFAFVEPVAKPL